MKNINIQQINITDEKYSVLPNGKQFAFWDCETVFAKTYYVSKNPNACDSNPGTSEEPFATINHAAQILMPGERVVIGGGVYDEFVQPARGGENAAKMISYEAAPGERVVITGAKEYKSGWTKPQNWAIGNYKNVTDRPVYEGNFEHGDFERVNPFSMINHPSHPWVEDFYISWAPKSMDWMPLFQRRGLLFCDGDPLVQVNSPRGLAELPGSYWVEDSGFKFLLHLKDSSNPANHVITYTCREQLFAPKAEGTAYVRVSGIEFEFTGNGVPGTQKGMVSSHMGNHWIIENNKLRWANSIGIDIGRESTIRDGRGMIFGGTIVRGNHVSYCGICGITGLGGNEGILIENNILVNNCWHDLQFNWESAAIKVHGVKNGLIRLNTIIDTMYGDGIWTDWDNANERVCHNFIFNTRRACHGAIFVEASDIPNRVDHNVIIGCKTYRFKKNPAEFWDGGHGIVTLDSSEIWSDENIIFDVEGEAHDMRIGSPDRIINGHGALGIRHRVIKNIIAKCSRAVLLSNPQHFTDGNIVDERSLSKNHSIAIEPPGTVSQLFSLNAAKKYLGWEENGRSVSIDYDYDIEAMTVKFDVKYNGSAMMKQIAIGQLFCLDDVFEFVAKA
ncbi:MAG: right-handed parallel beta-helix repeat-containing protein [Oscillospiraceae bacterium]|nr:right-handed parallel beta-helix repeat-containing protein [Oscillospiraceae bacterium]